MITLEPVLGLDTNPKIWTNDRNTHVIAKDGDGWFARDLHGELGPYPTLNDAMEAAHRQWDDAVALGPVLRLERDMRDARPGEGALRQLVEHLADYGPDGVEDLQALAHEALMKEEEA